MHLTDYRRQDNSWIPLVLCERQVDSLRNYIRQSFKTNENDQFLEILDAGYTDNDRFFEATGHYPCFKTCNNWVNIGLKKAGVKTVIWSPFDYGVMHHLQQKNK